MFSLELEHQTSTIEPGGHLCLFYDENPAEQIPALLPFIRDGLARDEQFVYIAADQSVEELALQLEAHGLDVTAERHSGRLKLYPRSQWRQPGELDSAKKAAQLRAFVSQAAQAGFAGIRFAVEMTWTLGPDIEARKLEHWEATINTLFDPGFPTRMICQYNRSRLRPEVMIAALHTHPRAILGREVYPNPFFEAPLILDGNGHGGSTQSHSQNGNGNGKETRARLDWMLGQLQQARQGERYRVEADALRAIINHSPECIKRVAADGTLLDLNPAGCRLLEVNDAKELIGKSVYDLIAPADRERFKAMNERVCGGHDETLVFQMVGLKGTRRIMETHAAPLRDPRTGGFNQIAVTRDVTEQRMAQDTWRFFAAVVESTDDAIVTKDLNGIITSWNRGAEQLFGYSAAEVIGQPISILIPTDRSDEEPNILARLRKGQRIEHYETVRQRKDGSRVNISLTVSPVKGAHGEIIGASKIARDITGKKLAEQALAKSREDLEKRVQERTASLRAAIAQMEEFSYSVSHDLRAPVRAMRGYAQAALDDYAERLDARGRDFLDRIIRGSSRMERLIHDILTYSRLARCEIQLQRVSLQKLLQDLVLEYPEIQAPRAEVVVRQPLHDVLAHEPLLTQAVSNLLINGVKFVAQGTVPRLQVWTEARQGKVRLWVEDNGIGIKPEYQHRLFGIFEKVHQDPRFDGTGIGLAIVRKAAEKMCGSVGVESDGITGSSFWLELPAATP